MLVVVGVVNDDDGGGVGDFVVTVLRAAVEPFMYAKKLHTISLCFQPNLYTQKNHCLGFKTPF